MGAWHKEQRPTDDCEPSLNDCNPTPILLYYNNCMTFKYSKDEKVIKDIVQRGVESTDPNQRIKLVVNYKSRKTSELVIKNNPCRIITHLKKSSVVYE